MPERVMAQHGELRNCLAGARRRVGQIWGLVPGRDRRPLVLAGILALLAGVLTLAVFALLARLVSVEFAQFRPEAGEPAATGRVWWDLGLLGLAVLTREALQLLGQYLVQRAGSRLGRDLTIALAARQHRADLAVLGAEPVGTRLGRHSERGRVVRPRLRSWSWSRCCRPCPSSSSPWRMPWRPSRGSAWCCCASSPRCCGSNCANWRPAGACRPNCSAARTGWRGSSSSSSAASSTCALPTPTAGKSAGSPASWKTGGGSNCASSGTILFGSLRVTTCWLFQFAVIGDGRGPERLGQDAGRRDRHVRQPVLQRLHPPVADPLRPGRRPGERPADRRCPGRPGGVAGPFPGGARPSPVREPQPELRKGTPVFETRDVVVEYRGALGGKRALDGVSLRIQAGEVVGIAGRSGSGKSTLARLLLRLVHPAAGQARLAGLPLEEVSREALARLAGYVGQEPFLFAGSVADNIAYGCPGAAARRHPPGRRAGRPARRDPGSARRLRGAGGGARAATCRGANGSAWPWPGCCCRTRRCWCWTRPPRPWTRPTSGGCCGSWSAAPGADGAAGGASAARRCGRPTGCWSSRMAGWWRKAPTRSWCAGRPLRPARRQAPPATCRL